MVLPFIIMLGANFEIGLRADAATRAEIAFKRVGEIEYATIDMLRDKSGLWVGTIPATFVTRDIEYVLRVDGADVRGPMVVRVDAGEKGKRYAYAQRDAADWLSCDAACEASTTCADVEWREGLCLLRTLVTRTPKEQLIIVN